MSYKKLVVPMLLVLSIFVSLSLASSASYPFKVVVDWSAPSSIKYNVYVSYSNAQAKIQEIDKNPYTILYKVVYGSSWQDAESKCDWPTVQDLSNNPPQGWYIPKVNGPINENLLNYSIHNGVSGGTENLTTNVIQLKGLGYIPQTTSDYEAMEENAYMGICVLAIDKALNTQKFFIKFTNPKNCVYDVVTEAWNPTDAHNNDNTSWYSSDSNGHTIGFKNWYTGECEHKHFSANGYDCRTYRDDVCGGTTEHGGTGVVAMGFLLNKTIANVPGSIPYGVPVGEDAFNSTNQIPSAIKNVVAFNWGLAAEDESQETINDYGAILIENTSEGKVGRMCKGKTSSSVDRFVWASESPWTKLEGTPASENKLYGYKLGPVTVLGAVAASPACNSKPWGKVSIQYADFRFHLSNVSSVPSLVNPEQKITLKCNAILDLPTVVGNNDKGNKKYETVAGPAGVYTCYNMNTLQRVDVDWTYTCSILDNLCRGHSNDNSCKIPVNEDNWWYVYFNGDEYNCNDGVVNEHYCITGKITYNNHLSDEILDAVYFQNAYQRVVYTKSGNCDSNDYSYSSQSCVIDYLKNLQDIGDMTSCYYIPETTGKNICNSVCKNEKCVVETTSR